MGLLVIFVSPGEGCAPRYEVMTEDDLGHIACHGNDVERVAAFAALYARLDGWLRGVVRRMAPPAVVEDVVASTWERFWRARSYDKNKGSVRPYLYAIARNATRDAIKQHPSATHEVAPTQVSDSVTDLAVAGSEAYGLLAATMPDQALVLRRQAFDDATGAKIATELGLTKGAVWSAAHRGRRFIATELAERAYRWEPPADSRGYVLLKGDSQLAAAGRGFRREQSFEKATVYSFSPAHGQFVLPKEVVPQGASRVCDQEHLRLWYYDLDTYEVAPRSWPRLAGGPAVFTRGCWTVITRDLKEQP